MPLSRHAITLIGALALALALVACGGPENDPPKNNQKPVKIAVTIKGTSVSTKSTRVDVQPGQPVEFDLDAQTAGELHVHSSPAQSYEFEPGRCTISLKPITVPGIVEVEEENAGKLIVQLVVK
jgi:hypothetical protein